MEGRPAQGAFIRYPLFSHLASMIKDVGGRLALLSHRCSHYREPCPILRHQTVRSYRLLTPFTERAAFIAPNAHIQGHVVLGEGAAVFFHATLRNFHTRTATTMGDKSVAMDRSTMTGQVRLGGGAVVGIGASLDCCDVHENAVVGHGATVALGAVVERGAIVAAGAVVEKDTRIAAGEVWAGAPAVKIGDVTEDQARRAREMWEDALKAAEMHQRSIERLFADNEVLDDAWLEKTLKMVEEQQKSVALPLPGGPIPLEAQQFLAPRVNRRRPDAHLRTSSQVRKTAPWLSHIPEASGNA